MKSGRCGLGYTAATDPFATEELRVQRLYGDSAQGPLHWLLGKRRGLIGHDVTDHAVAMVHPIIDTSELHWLPLLQGRDPADALGYAGWTHVFPVVVYLPDLPAVLLDVFKHRGPVSVGINEGVLIAEAA